MAPTVAAAGTAGAIGAFVAEPDDPAPDQLPEATGDKRSCGQLISDEYEHDRRAQKRTMVISRGQVLTAGEIFEGFEVGRYGAYALDICRRAEITAPAPGRRLIRFGPGSNQPPAIALVGVRSPEARGGLPALSVYCSCGPGDCPHLYASVAVSLGAGIEGLAGTEAARIQEDWRELPSWPVTSELLRFLDRAAGMSDLVSTIYCSSERSRAELISLLTDGHIAPVRHQVPSVAAAMNRR